MARRNKLDYFPFFPKDCEADETIRIMDDSEIGFWVRLMCYQWPNGSVPADPELLMRGVFGTAPGGVPRTLDYIREKLAGPVGQRMRPHPERDGRIADPRLLAEREIAENLISARSKNGKAGAEKRWADGKTNSNGEVEPMRNADLANASASVLFCSNTKDSKRESEEKCDEFARLYPAHRLDNYGAQCFISSAEQDGILERLRLAVKSDDWTRENGRYVPKASKWILDGAPGPTTQPAGASAPPSVVSTMDPEIRRRLAERKRNGLFGFECA